MMNIADMLIVIREGLMKKLLTLIILLWAAPAICAVSILGVSGTYDDSSPNVVISGSGFGTHPLTVQSLKANIENGTVGNTLSGASGWNTPADSSSWYAVRYNSTQKHSGSKSLYGHWDGPAQHYGSDINFNNGSHWEHGTQIYVTYWVRFTYTGAAGQWKWFRLRPDTSVGDISPEIMLSSWPAGEKYALCRPNSYATSTWTTDAGEQGNSRGGIYFTTSPYSGSLDPPSTNGTWCRVEFLAEPSTQGGTDGSFKYSIHRPGTGIRTPVNLTNLMTYGPSQSDRWQGIIIGHYWGNAASTTAAEFWVDDVYKQTGTQARVELGNASTWSACTWREIQLPTAWASGQITCTFNTGSFSTGQTAYLYVVDSTGAYNSTGTPVTIGASGSYTDTTPPVLSNPLPTGAQTCTTDPRNVTLQITSDEAATVKYDTTDKSYDTMTYTFSTTGETSHSTVVSNTCGTSKTYYCRAMDSSGNKDTSSTSISYTVESAPVGDIVNPVVTITNPATDPYDTTSHTITVSGTASDETSLASVTASCPACQTTGAVTGTTTWSIPLTLSQGTLGIDLLYGQGAFSATGTWNLTSNWTISGGAISNSGVSTNSWLSHPFNAEAGERYRLYYEVTSYTSGTLYLSQYGFSGTTTLLDTSAGTHTLDLTCSQVSELAFVANNWIGTLDNVLIKKIQRDVLTMTAHDATGNTSTDIVNLGYTAPSDVPRKVVGLGGVVRINLGNGIQLEF